MMGRAEERRRSRSCVNMEAMRDVSHIKQKPEKKRKYLVAFDNHKSQRLPWSQRAYHIISLIPQSWLSITGSTSTYKENMHV